MIHPFIEKMRTGKVCLGTNITFNDPTITEVLCRTLDFVWIDMEPQSADPGNGPGPRHGDQGDRRHAAGPARVMMGIVSVWDISSIGDLEKRAVAERLAIRIGTRWLLERPRIRSSDDLVGVVIEETPR